MVGMLANYRVRAWVRWVRHIEPWLSVPNVMAFFFFISREPGTKPFLGAFLRPSAPYCPENGGHQE